MLLVPSDMLQTPFEFLLMCPSPALRMATAAQAAHHYREEQDDQAEPQERVKEEGEQGNKHPLRLSGHRALSRCSGARSEKANVRHSSRGPLFRGVTRQ
jgi:hypothetical protein